MRRLAILALLVIAIAVASCTDYGVDGVGTDTDAQCDLTAEQRAAIDNTVACLRRGSAVASGADAYLAEVGSATELERRVAAFEECMIEFDLSALP